MVNTETLKVSIRKEKTNLKQHVISDREFEEKMREAEQDIKNGNLFTLEEVMEGALEALENGMTELSNEDKAEVRDIMNSWRTQFVSKI